MTAFLHQLAQQLLGEHGTDLRKVAVVLPSQRAGLFLRKWLGEEARKALWSPQLFTIGSFMENLSGLRPLANEELMLEGFEAYRALAGNEGRKLEEFMQWGATTLADISEADAHLVDLKGYYRNLREWEELGWSFEHDPLSEGQQRMVHFWEMVGRLHHRLDERLKELGAGTTGLIERTATERMQDQRRNWSMVWFAGLNALSPAQKTVIRFFATEGLARFAWDTNRFFLDRDEQEAGMYQRPLVKEFGQGVIPIAEERSLPGLRVETVKATNTVAQAWVAAELLRGLPPEERAGTAVVLADEGLLQPLLEALPADIGKLNITMGMPAGKLPVGSFLAALHQLYAKADPGRGFFHADLERFLGHPFLQGAGCGGRILEKMRARNLVFQSAGGLRELVQGLIDEVPMEAPGPLQHALKVFVDIGEVYDRPAERMQALTGEALAWAHEAVHGDRLASEQLYQASLILQRVGNLLKRYGHHLDVKSYALVFRKLLAGTRIGFAGEPLAGVQVMGMLEARVLDPERVIVLGVQEGVLPASTAGRSFIPYELRRYHHMPMPHESEAVQAYNFFRLLQRSKQVTLVWSEDEEAKGPSRFILQLQHEWFNGLLAERAVELPLVRGGTAGIEVRKDGQVLGKIRKYLASGLSPSALATLLGCPLDFYFRYVLGLKEPEEVETRIPANILGSAIHATLQQIYQTRTGMPLDADDLDRMGRPGDSPVDGLLQDELLKEMKPDQLTQGEPLLQRHMAISAVKRFLRDEAETVRQGNVVQVEEQEKDLQVGLRKELVPHADTVLVRGRLDRVDRMNGELRILDYKTGKVDPGSLNLPEFTIGVLQQKGRRYAAQLLVYAWLYLGQHPDTDKVQAGLLPLRMKHGSEPVLLSVGAKKRTVITREDLPAISGLLAEVVNGLLDPDQGFAHDPENTYCRFCYAAGATETPGTQNRTGAPLGAPAR